MSQRHFAHRRHAFEFGDQSWMKGAWRAAYLDCLNFGLRVGGQFRPVHKAYSAWAQRAGAGTVLDLGSGGAAPIETLILGARADGNAMPKIVLSDLFPSAAHYEAMKQRLGAEAIDYVSEPVSALKVDRPDLPARSICSTFHHFRPDDARALVEDAIRNGSGLFILEPLQRNLRHFLLVLLSGPFAYMLAPFFARRFSVFSLLFCTLLPIIPLMVMWDGCVSALRMYTPDEIRAMIPEELRTKVDVETGEFPYIGAFGATFVAMTRRR